jgi:glycosyl transferase family 25
MHPSGSQGYWLSRTGAAKLLAEMAAPSKELDKALDRCWQLGMQVFLLDPPAVYEEPSSVSMISKRSKRKRPGWMARRLEGWRRRIANNRQKNHVRRQLAK